MTGGLIVFGLTVCLISCYAAGTNNSALDMVVHMSSLRLKCAPSILWHQRQNKRHINNETEDAREREELNQFAHQYDVHYDTIDAFFKAQQEGNLLVRYSLLGSNISTKPTKTIIKDPADLKLKMITLSKVMLENLNQARDDLIAGNCRDDLAKAMNKEVEESKLDSLHETALTRALGYLIDICQLHFTWIQGSPEYRKIVL